MKNAPSKYLLLEVIASFLLLSACNEVRTDKPKDDTDTKIDSINPDTVSNCIKIGTLSRSISYYEKGDRVLGYEYELATNFAKDINKEAKFIICKDVNELLDKLKLGEIEIVAYPIVMSNENRQAHTFTNNTYITHQVLVQRKDEQGQTSKKKRKNKSKKDETPKTNLVKDVTQLIGKEVWVVGGTKHEERLRNLNDEIGGGIIIKTCKENENEEDLIDKVSKKQIDFTVCDEKDAQSNSSEYNNIDLGTSVSFDQRAAWVVNDSTLLNAVNGWKEKRATEKLIKNLNAKYFSTHQFVTVKQNVKVYKIPQGSHEISNYDPYFKAYGKQYGFDWRLIAAIAFKESRFHPDVIGWSGSIGLMQLMPITGKHLGISREDLFDPELNIKAGCQCLKTMESYYKGVKEEDKIKFLLAAYNAGIGHIVDARELAKKYGKDPNVWDDNVEPFVRLKSNKQYYTDPVVKHGYSNGNNVCNYVATIMAQYNEYKSKFKE